MTNPIPYATPVNVQRLPFKDRRTSLIVAGIFLLLLGGLSACFGALTPIGMFFASTVPPVPATRPVGAGASGPAVTVGATPFPMDFRTIAAAVMVYLGIAGVLIWAGVGAVRVRRWARPVTLVFAGMWLAMGAVGLVYWLLAAPSLQQAMVANSPPGSARPPAAVYSAIAWGTGTFMALLMIVLPAVIVWVFARSGVKETLEFFDPRLRWTDSCPIPVLAVSAWLAVSAAASLLYAVYGVMPLFGLVVGGPVGVAGLVVVAAVFGLLAWQTYRLRPAAWWGALVAVALWAGNTLWTFSHVGWDEFYRRAGYSPRQTEMMMRYGGGSETGMLWMVGLLTLLWIGLLLYSRKYFERRESPPTATTC